MILANHSWVHSRYTYRELAVTVLAGSAMVLKLWIPDKLWHRKSLNSYKMEIWEKKMGVKIDIHADDFGESVHASEDIFWTV